MEIRVHNLNFIPIGIIDVFDSLLWVDAYSNAGSFKLVTRNIQETLAKLSTGQYLSIQESEHFMLIEEISIKNDDDLGTILTVTGSSLEVILNRRIVWNRSVLKENFQTSLLAVLSGNAINCSDPNRNIEGLTYSISTDPDITSLTVDGQVYGEGLYDLIASLCETKGIGFKLIPNIDDKTMVFSFYAGKNRSLSQIINSPVIYSDSLDNLISSDFKQSFANLKNVAIIAGEEGVGNQRRTIVLGETSGLDRREIFVDAKDVTRDVPDEEEPLTDEEYDNLLTERGYTELYAHLPITTFDTEIDPLATYVYNQDYFMGDIIQISDAYGHDKSSRVVEIIFCQDESGTSINPTLIAIEEGV